MRYDPERTRLLIEQLQQLCDPIALASWIVKKTRRGKQPGPEAWTYTRQFFTDYNRPQDAETTITAFGQVGVTDEVDASVWIAEHMDRIS